MPFRYLIFFVALALGSCKKKSEIDAKAPSIAPPSWKLEDFSDPIDPRWEWRNQILLNFPQVEFRREGPFRLKTPDWISWAATSASTGPIALRISVPKGADPAILESFAHTARGFTSTKTLRLYIENARPAPELSEAPRRHFFFTLRSEHRESPYRDLCAYLDRWLRAEQVLVRAPRPEDPRTELDCSFVPSKEKRRSESSETLPQIVLSHFAVPYTDPSGTEFPVKSLDGLKLP